MLFRFWRLMGISVAEALRAVADIAMPRTCVVCGRKLLLRERHICTECEIGLPLTYFSRQRDNPMATAFNSMIQSEIDSAGEDASYEPFSYAGSLLFYSGSSPYKNIPRRLKYGRDFSEGRHFAAMLGRELAASPLFADVDAVVPVPLHRARKWRRGYNQAEVIARAVAKELGPAEDSPAETGFPSATVYGASCWDASAIARKSRAAPSAPRRCGIPSAIRRS